MHDLLHEELNLCRLYYTQLKKKTSNDEDCTKHQRTEPQAKTDGYQNSHKNDKKMLYYGGDQLRVLVEVCGPARGSEEFS